MTNKSPSSSEKVIECSGFPEDFSGVKTREEALERLPRAGSELTWIGLAVFHFINEVEKYITDDVDPIQHLYSIYYDDTTSRAKKDITLSYFIPQKSQLDLDFMFKNVLGWNKNLHPRASRETTQEKIHRKLMLPSSLNLKKVWNESWENEFLLLVDDYNIIISLKKSVKQIIEKGDYAKDIPTLENILKNSITYATISDKAFQAKLVSILGTRNEIISILTGLGLAEKKALEIKQANKKQNSKNFAKASQMTESYVKCSTHARFGNVTRKKNNLT